MKPHPRHFNQTLPDYKAISNIVGIDTTISNTTVISNGLSYAKSTTSTTTHTGGNIIVKKVSIDNGKTSTGYSLNTPIGSVGGNVGKGGVTISVSLGIPGITQTSGGVSLGGKGVIGYNYNLKAGFGGTMVGFGEAMGLFSNTKTYGLIQHSKPDGSITVDEYGLHVNTLAKAAASLALVGIALAVVGSAGLAMPAFAPGFTGLLALLALTTSEPGACDLE